MKFLQNKRKLLNSVLILSRQELHGLFQIVRALTSSVIILPKSLGSKPQVVAACAIWACTEYLFFLTWKQETTYPLE